MSTEAPPKRESYTGWTVGVGVLFLMAIVGSFGVLFFKPHEIRFDLSDGTTNAVTWTCRVDGESRTGVTNLPAVLTFKGRTVDFHPQPVTPGAPLVMRFQWLDNIFPATNSASGGIRFEGTYASWRVHLTN